MSKIPTREEMFAPSSERMAEIEKSRAEAIRRMYGTNPTPTQEENDLAAKGQHVDNKKADGAPADTAGAPMQATPDEVPVVQKEIPTEPVKPAVSSRAESYIPRASLPQDSTSGGYQTRNQEPRHQPRSGPHRR